MENPVVLIGQDDHGLKVVGLYESMDAAKDAVRNLPEANYSVMTPSMNGYVQRRTAERAIVTWFE